MLTSSHAVDALGEQASALRVVTHPTGGHLLPLDCPEWCVQVLTEAMDRAKGAESAAPAAPVVAFKPR